jgi:hypothetical protein
LKETLEQRPRTINPSISNFSFQHRDKHIQQT